MTSLEAAGPASPLEQDGTPGLSVSLKLPEGGGELSLAFVPLEDLDVTLRQLLAEHPQSCAYTSFRLQLLGEEEDSAEPTFLTESFDIAAFLEGVPEGAVPILRLAMVLEAFCVRTVRQHVRRFQDVLLRHPPVALPQVTHTPEEKESEAEQASRREKKKSEDDDDPIAAATGLQIAAELIESDLSETDFLGLLLVERTRISAATARYGKPTLPFPVDLAKVFPVPVPGAPVTPGPRDGATVPPAAAAVAAPGYPACLHSVTLSGYNPPPAPRLMQGDLLYLRVETLEGRALHVTATPAGFFVNRSDDGGAFDPAPAQPAFHSRTLWALLHRASHQFRTAYAALLLSAAQTAAAQATAARSVGDEESDTADLSGLGPMYGVVAVPSAAGSTLAGPGASPFVHSSDIASAMGSASASVSTALFGMALAPAGGFALARAPWLVPPPALAPQRHTLDPRRAEDALLCAYGMDDRGSLRDWNEEWASVQELPASTFQERLLRARARARVCSDFVDAATQGAIAIVQGHVPPLNPSEASRMHV